MTSDCGCRALSNLLCDCKTFSRCGFISTLDSDQNGELALRPFGSTLDIKSDSACQKNEVRLTNSRRPPSGIESIHSIMLEFDGSCSVRRSRSSAPPYII